MLTTAFENDSLQNLNIDFKIAKKYIFKIITNLEDIHVIQMNSKIDEVSAPSCSKCLEFNFYTDIESCINKKISDYFYEKIDFSLSEQTSRKDEISLNIVLFINTMGVLKLQEIKAPNVFEEYIRSIVQKYPIIFSPKKYNCRLKNYNYRFFLKFKKGDKPQAKALNCYFDHLFKPTTSNDLASYFKKKTDR